MPTFTETKNAASSAMAQVRALEASLSRTKDLGSGYRAIVSFSAKGNKVDVEFHGPNDNIRKIPREVLIRYGLVLNKVRKWMNDEEPDFPAL